MNYILIPVLLTITIRASVKVTFITHNKKVRDRDRNIKNIDKNMTNYGEYWDKHGKLIFEYEMRCVSSFKIK